MPCHGVSSDDHRWWFLVSEVERAELERLSKKETKIEVSPTSIPPNPLFISDVYMQCSIDEEHYVSKITSSFQRRDQPSLF